MKTDNIHNWFESLIATYLADGLSGQELAEFESHRDECAECRKSLNEAQRFESVLFQTLAMDKSPIDIAGRVSAAIVLKQPSSLAINIWNMIRGLNPLRMPRYVTGPAVAIMIVLIGMITLQTTYMMNSPRKTKSSPAPSSLIHPWLSWIAGKETKSSNINLQYSSDKAIENGFSVQPSPAGDMYMWKVNHYNDSPQPTSENEKKPHTATWTGTEMVRFGDDPTKTPANSVDEISRSLTIMPATTSRLEDAPTNVKEQLKGQLPKESGYLGEDSNKNGNFPDGAYSEWGGPVVYGSTGQGAIGNLIPAPLAAGAPMATDRKVVKSGTLTFEVDSFEATYQRVVAVLIEEKGYIASSQSSKLPNGKVQGEIVIRTMPERFDTVVLKLRNLGELKNQQVSAEDITKQYVDLQARLKNTQALEERLVKLMDRKGEMKDLLTVEKELAGTREKIEQLQGEIKYYDNLVALSTLRLLITEKDIGKPFEFVQTQSANLILTVADVVTAYQRAQAIILGLNGQVIEAQVTNQDKRVIGVVKAYTDADQFNGLLEQLKGLGEVRSAVSEQRQSAPQGTPTGDKTTPVRKEKGLVSLTLNLPQGEYIQTKQARVALETSDVDSAYARAQEIAQGLQAKILTGNVNRGTDQTSAVLVCQAPADNFRALVEAFKGIAKVKFAAMDEKQTAQNIDPKSLIPAPVHKEPGLIELSITSPAAIVTESEGFGATLRNTLKGSISGLLWSLKMLVVGLVTIGPWLVLVALVVILIKRWRRTKNQT